METPHHNIPETEHHAPKEEGAHDSWTEHTELHHDHDTHHDTHGAHLSKEEILRDVIVGPAWELVMENSLIKKFNFFPSLLSSIYLGCIILYQLAFSYVYIFKLNDQFFALIIDFVHTTYFLQTISALVIGVILYIFITPIAEGWLVSLIAKAEEQEWWPKELKNGIGYGLSRWLLNFLPIFELTNSLSIFKLLSIITFYLFLLRVFGKEYFVVITVLMSIYLIFSFLINILFSYARFFIIFDHKKAVDSLSMSVRMALDNLQITFHLYFTLLLVYIRTFITAIIFIIFPFIISALLTYVTTAIIQVIFITLISILFIGLLVFIAHLNSVLEIFVETIWYNAFKENKKRFHGAADASDHHGGGHH